MQTSYPIALSKDDVQNIIAFGNRSQMSGQEADLWVELKRRLAGELENAIAAAQRAEHDDTVASIDSARGD